MGIARRHAQPASANVKVIESKGPIAPISSMVQDMETRRDISESLIKAKILNMELDLLKVLDQLCGQSAAGNNLTARFEAVLGYAVNASVAAQKRALEQKHDLTKTQPSL